MPRLTTTLALLLTVVTPATAGASVPRSVVQDDIQLLRAGIPARDAALETWQRAGADTIRVLVVWRDVEREPQRLDVLADAIDAARARGLDVLLTPTGPGPRAASRCRPRRAVCNPDARRYGRWVASLARRFPAVHKWALWNEPNSERWLQPQRARDGRPLSPHTYRALARAASRAVRTSSGHRRDLVLAGETAPAYPDPAKPMLRRNIKADDFLAAVLFRGGGIPLASGIGHHPYPTSLKSPLGLGAREQYTLSGLPRLRKLAVRAARRHRLGGTGVWLTELGFQTNPPDDYVGMPPPRQAAFIARADRWAATHGADAISQYLLVDEPNRFGFQSGLMFNDGRPKPSLDMYRLPVVLTRLPRGRVELWARVRPAPRGRTIDVAVDNGIETLETVRVPASRRGIVRITLPATVSARRLRVQWREGGDVRISSPWVRVPRRS